MDCGASDIYNMRVDFLWFTRQDTGEDERRMLEYCLGIWDPREYSVAPVKPYCFKILILTMVSDLDEKAQVNSAYKHFTLDFFLAKTLLVKTIL